MSTGFQHIFSQIWEGEAADQKEIRLCSICERSTMLLSMHSMHT